MTIIAIYKILLHRRRRKGQKGRLARGNSRNANVDDDGGGGHEGSGREEEEEEEPGQQLKEYELMKWRRRVEREVELEMGIRVGEGSGGG